MKPHSTEVVALHENPPGDHRFVNNLFVGNGDLSTFERAVLPVYADGNVYFKGTKPCKQDKAPLLNAEADAAVRLVQSEKNWRLEITFGKGWAGDRKRPIVTSELLGKTAISNAAFEQPDGKPIRITTDYFGKPRSETNPTPGPFELPGDGKLTLDVW